MRLVLISDTHYYAESTPLPEGDVLVHCGDFSITGSDSELYGSMKWFRDLDFKHKVCIAGNHDQYEEEEPGFMSYVLGDKAHYLYESFVEIEGLKFWGSPIQPIFNNWSYNRDKKFRSTYWKEYMPDDVDVLLTHCPPRDILDTTYSGARVGCKHLGFRIAEVRPILSVFGHIHESRGVLYKDGIGYVNASLVGKGLTPTHNPYVVDIYDGTPILMQS